MTTLRKGDLVKAKHTRMYGTVLLDEEEGSSDVYCFVYTANNNPIGRFFMKKKVVIKIGTCVWEIE